MQILKYKVKTEREEIIVLLYGITWYLTILSTQVLHFSFSKLPNLSSCICKRQAKKHACCMAETLANHCLVYIIQ